MIQSAVKRLASGIGLASESYQYHRDKQRSQDTSSTTSSPSEGYFESAADLDTIWDLNETEHARGNKTALNPLKEMSGTEDPQKIVACFLARHPLVTGEHNNKLPMPVVIPQRRPRSGTRGFIPAYAPLLLNCGINQSTFLEFIHDLNSISLPNPWIQAINLASLATLALPSITGIVISRAVQKGTNAASELHSRSKVNLYLDQMNEHFFHPRNLHCLVMTWNPNDSSLETSMNFQQAITADTFQPSPNLNDLERRIRSSGGNALSDFGFPEAAPLVFPIPSERSGSSHDRTTKSRFQRSKDFVDEYVDNRAQAQWARENGDTEGAKAASQKFSSRYADPNHPASNGRLISLLTGGQINPSRPLEPDGAVRGRIESRAGAIKKRLATARSASQDRHTKKGMGNSDGLLDQNPLHSAKYSFKNLLRKDVLYLVIVELPCPEDLAQASSAYQDGIYQRKEHAANAKKLARNDNKGE